MRASSAWRSRGATQHSGLRILSTQKRAVPSVIDYFPTATTRRKRTRKELEGEDEDDAKDLAKCSLTLETTDKDQSAKAVAGSNKESSYFRDATPPVRVVLDTNILLDLWLHRDSATQALQEALNHKTVNWLATQGMRDELERVLTYQHIVWLMDSRGITADHILSCFDKHAQLMPTAPKALHVCKDADDQKFIDLAATHMAQLISKDKAVLKMRKRMAHVGVAVGRSFPALLL